MTLSLRRDVSATDTEDGMVLLDEANGRYWQLNTTAALVLHALLDGATTQQAAQRLTASQKGVSTERAAQDVAAMVTSLGEADLVVVAP
jgi:hypothetical protein